MTNSNKSIPDSYHQGYCYFDVTTGKFWIDTTNDASGRLAINGANTIYGEISRETVSGPYELSYAYDNYKTVLDEGCILIVTAKNDIAAEAQVIIDKTTEELIYIYQNNLPLQGNIIQANDTVLLAYYNGKLNLIENFTAQGKKEKTANIYYIKGSGSTTGVAGSRASVWRGQLPIQLDDYYDGLTVLYVPDIPGVTVQGQPGDGPTGGGGVRLELSDNTNTTINNNQNICYYNNTAITTHYPVGVPILLTYTNDKWVRADYNTNTTYSTMSVAVAKAGTTTTGQLMSASNTKAILMNLAGTGLTATHDTTNGVQINHSTTITEVTTTAIYPITINNTGHITSYSSAVTAMPASDVYSWAKQENKPSYSLNEIDETDNLQAIEGLTDTAGLLRKSANNTWILDTKSYVTSSGVTSARIQAVAPLISSNSATTETELDTIISFKETSANYVFAGATSGSTTSAPSFRELVAADIPNLNASKITAGTVGAARLPAATTTTKGAVIVGDNISLSSGKISLTKENVISALGYTPIEEDTNTTYSFAEGTNSFTVTPSDGIGQTVTIIPSISLTANTATAITNSFAIINSVTATGTTSHTITVSSKNLTATSGITMTATATQITVKHATVVTAATSYGNTSTYVKSINIDIYGHITGATTGTYSDADEKVNQVLTTSGSMPILFSSNNNTNTATTVNGDVLRNNDIYGNLETGVLYSNGLGISGSTTITGALNVTGNTNLHNETYAESLTTGSLLTTGNVNFVQIPTAPTANDETNNNQLATTEFVKKQFKANDAMQFKGIVNSNSDLPSTAETGYVYRVGTADTYANEECEIGDMIICISNESGTSPIWGVIQTNLDGAIIGPASSEANHVAVFTGNTGKALKDSGFIFNPTSSQIASVDEVSIPGIYTYKGSIPYSGATHYGTLTVLGPSTYASTILISSSNGCAIPVMGISRKMGGSGSSYFMPVGVFSSTEIASNRVIISDGVQGNIKASNFTIGTSVPATAVFTDTTYSAATTADLGLTQYTAANLDTQINQLTIGSTTPSRDDYMIIQHRNGGTTTRTYHRKAVSAIFGALNSEDITTALGYTPYDSSNPNGYTSNTGTVTSITISAGTGISVTSTTAAITSSGTRTISLANTYGDTKNPYGSKTANYVLAGPINGSSAVPGFRKLVEADLPNSYLPLSGGTVTGSILPGNNNITLGNNTTAWSAIYANEFYGDGSNLTNLPTTYWANIETTSAATFNAAPEMAILTLNGNTTATTAATAGVSLVFSAVTNSLNFVFM